jgi:hypothetical protein
MNHLYCLYLIVLNRIDDTKINIQMMRHDSAKKLSRLSNCISSSDYSRQDQVAQYREQNHKYDHERIPVVF